MSDSFTATFGHHPCDVLTRVLDIAGFTMHAILRVDLQARVGAVIVAHDLKRRPDNNAAWRVVERQIVGDRHFGVGQVKWAG